jgi:beta-carotene ketolase (CrtW type)
MVTRDAGNAIGATRTTKVGVGLAATIIGAWLATHVLAVFLIEVSAQTFALVPLIIALQSWLSVGLFIMAHDAIHGTLAPASKRRNNAVGRIATTLYGGFDFHKLARDHHLHHRHSGTDADPDFSAAHPRNPVLWALAFFWRHLTWRVLLFFPLVFSFEVHLLGAERLNLFLFFSLPAILSALQLFFFGTFLPHRHSDGARFADEHRARSSDFGPLVSLLSCYHFGYHHEHHLYPHVPWWRLPEMRWRHADPA